MNLSFRELWMVGCALAAGTGVVLMFPAGAEEKNGPATAAAETSPAETFEAPPPHIPKEAELRADRDALMNAFTTPGYRIEDEKVRAVMAAVAREEFCPPAVRRFAYVNRPLPIGEGQTISQPYIVAFMTEALELKPSDRVLEIGTGSGYQAAVLSHLAKEVYSIEIVESLATEATETLKRLGYENVTVKAGDGYQGWEEHAPFDAVIVTCAPEDIPQPLVDQLKGGGRMVIPAGSFGEQMLYLLEKRGGEVKQKALLPVAFVPMTGKAEGE